jgi:putative flippase GtrA
MEPLNSAARHNGNVPRRPRFAAAMTAVARRLPFGLAGVVPPSLLGYLLINLCTFCLDLGLLTAAHGTLKWPLPVAVTLSYGTASAVSYTANRILNFRSHGPLGTQLPLYLAVIASNYLIWILGVTDALAALGVEYQIARIIAALCEAAYLYAAMRWIVFRDSGWTVRRDATGDATEPREAPESARRAPAARRTAPDPDRGGESSRA